MENPRVEYEQSAEIGEIAKALAAAQDEMHDAVADSTNPHFQSTYADLASVRKAARPAAKHGLAVVQQVLSAPDGTPGVRTLLAHSSGQWMASIAYVKPDRNGPQAVGSVLTYLRRYMLAAALGIAQADDDANGAQKPADAPKAANKAQQKPAAKQEPPKAPAGPSRIELSKRLNAALAKLELTKVYEGMEETRARGWWCAQWVGRKIVQFSDIKTEELPKLVERAEAGEIPSDQGAAA